MLEKTMDKVAQFFDKLSQYFEQRWESARRTGTGGTAGKIRGASEKIYNRLLGKIDVIIEMMPNLTANSKMNFLDQADKSLHIELETDNAALQWTPEHFTRAQAAHERLRASTLEMIDEINELKATYEVEVGKESVQETGLMDAQLCQQRRDFIQEYIDFRIAEESIPQTPIMKMQN